MILTKQNYLEIHVGISTRAKWYLELQKKMNRLNVECKKSRFHITALFIVPVSIISLEDLQKQIAGINLPEFTLVLKTIEYRYKTRDLKKGYIEGWTYDETNKRFYKVEKNELRKD